MIGRFRDFMIKQPFVVSIYEDEAAPAMGVDNSPPSDPSNSSNSDNHFDAFKRVGGMGDDDFDAAMDTSNITIYPSLDYANKWGFIASGPVNCSLEKRPDGMYDVLFHLNDKKLLDPQSFFFPYKEGQRPIPYKGPVQDQKEVMSANELQNLMTKPLEAGGAAAAGGAPPMGGI